MTYLDAAVSVRLNDGNMDTLYKELKFASESDLEAFIENFLIPGVEARVKTITGVSTPTADQGNITLGAQMALTNLLAYMRVNRMGPILQNPTGFNLSIPIVKAFTSEVMTLLEDNRYTAVRGHAYVHTTGNIHDYLRFRGEHC